MNRLIFPVVLAVALQHSALQAQAPSVLSHIPDDVRGFAVLRNVDGTLSKIETLAEKLEAPLPPLRAMLTQFDDGLQMQGDFGVAWLDQREGDDDQSMYTHFVAYIPVSDFDAFLAQFSPAAPDAKIAAIEFQGQEFAIARKGNFALFADVEETASLEHVLNSQNDITKTSKLLTDWSVQNDLTVSLAPKGTDLMFDKLMEGLAMIRQFASAGAGVNANMLDSAFDLYKSMFEMSQRECEQLAIGLRIDPDNSISLHKRVLLDKSGSLAGAEVIPVSEDAWKGVPDGPFVVAFQGALPSGWSKDLMAVSFNMMNQMQSSEDEKLSDEKIKQLSEQAVQTMQGVQAMSFTMGVPEANEGIYGRTTAIFQVEDAKAFLANYKTSISKMNTLMEGTKMADAYSVTEETVDGQSVLHLTMDMTKFALGDPDLAEVLKEQYQRMFGPDGKISLFLASPSESTVVMAYTSLENLERVMEYTGKAGLASDAQVKKTAAMLPEASQWQGYISPEGIMRFASTMVGTFAPGAEFDLGEYPASPPIGFAVQLTPTHLDGHLVVPMESILAAKGFAEQMAEQ